MWAVKVENGEILSINVSQVRSNLLIESAHVMIDRIFADHPDEWDRRDLLKELISTWIQIKETYIDRKDDFKDSDIRDFQVLAYIL